MSGREPSQRGGWCVIYEWNASERFLLWNVLPQGRRIGAKLTDTAEEVASKLPPDVRTFIFHLDVSLAAGFPRHRTPLIRLLLSRGINVLNGDAVDVRKRTIQRCCRRLGLNSVSVERSADPGQLVIVKTNLNYGGEREDALSDAEKRELGIPLGKPAVKRTLDYKVMPLGEVDESWWSDERLVIERYVSNRENKIYRFYVMRDSVVLSEAVNPHLIKKMDPGLERRDYFLRLLEDGFSDLTEAGPRLQKLLAQGVAFIRGFRLDFGTMDAVMSDDGEAYIVDATTTPYWGDETRQGVVEFLRTGVP